MFKGNKKYEVSDPAFYTPLITKQKKHLRLNSTEADEWVRLGALCESKLKMTNDFAKKFLAIRYSLIIFVTLGLLFFITVTNLFPDPTIISNKVFFLILAAKISLVLWFPFLWNLRYPPSGAKYFKKALKLDPECADAYMGLGFIALRRYQKKRAFDFMEQAVRLERNQKKMERELKSIYAKEFAILFETKSD
ncbi:MAG: tetratricopeptide repeat protein, partial [Desulfobacteraceae bacterium]|nr:tetratricopeptide repeat protein [Desulfobacteraceae bacterium]